MQLENREHYKPLEAPMVNMTQAKVNQIIDKLHWGKYINDMNKKWLAITPSPPIIPVFYTLTKIHKPVPVGRPIISGCDGPTENISSFVDTLLQPIAQKQQSYINVCAHTNASPTINTLGGCININSKYTCISQNVVYVIKCRTCNKIYIGEGRPYLKTL